MCQLPWADFHRRLIKINIFCFYLGVCSLNWNFKFQFLESADVHLTKYTDYGLRALIYLVLNPDRSVPTAEIAGVFGVSQSHLTKVVNCLAEAGLVRTYRGKNGGSRLIVAPADIRIGKVVRELEEDLSIIDCEHSNCPMVPACDLRAVVQQALKAFLEVLDQYTLEDIVGPRRKELLQRLSPL